MHFQIEDHHDGLDLNRRLLRRPASTFFMRMMGSDMAGYGILDGDLLIVDRSIKAQHGHMVIAVVHGEMVLRRLELDDSNNHDHDMVWYLVSMDLYQTVIREKCNIPLDVWGVVIHTIHSFVDTA